MSSLSQIWSSGRYEAVGERIAGIAENVVTAVDRRHPIRNSAVVDLACGSGNAALIAARSGARVTGVDITPELLQIGEDKARAAGLTVAWHTADAADTGLSAGSFDAAVSNMGIIFVEPHSQVVELARLLKPGGVFGFSSWVRDSVNPLFDPVVEVLGVPPAREYLPEQWGEPATAAERLSADFDAIDSTRGVHTWQFASPDDALAFVTRESPMHVDIMGRADPTQRDRLIAAFGSALRDHMDGEGRVSFGSSYVVVTAIRR
jgi:SAM-dependent methyltransferase